MKIYLLTQDENSGYDTYDSCVVVAESAQDAKTITPSGNTFKENTNGYYNDWADTFDGIEVEEIGEANDRQRRGVICASFNAG